MIRPDFDTFCALAEEGDLVAVTRSFPFDTETAVTAFAKLRRGPFAFLLESVTGGERWARWTFLGTEPREAWRADPIPGDGRSGTSDDRSGGGDGGTGTGDGGASPASRSSVRRWTPEGGWGDPVPVDDPIADLAARLRARKPVVPAGVPRFFGGAVGYLGYDVVRHIERLPDPPPDPLGLPEAVLMFTDVVLAVDNVYGRAHAIATVDVSGAAEPGLQECYDAAVARIDALIGRLASETPPEPVPEPPSEPFPESFPESGAGPVGGPSEAGAAGATASFSSSFSRPAFESAVRRIKEYIAAGDAFQVVLSQRLDVELADEPFLVYRRLRSLNPSPYMYFLELDGVSIVGSSPEVLVRVEDDVVTVRPIAGTRPRGGSEAEDRELEADLLADPKERAEHLMLVDLGRNDVGRVAEYGSVRVPDLMEIERYSHVLHIVSQVEGDLRPGLDAFDAFRATFPAGTVSGAPKVRAMEIIDELEPARRGPYAGAVGYFAYGGKAMDTAIAIRTLVAANGRAHVQAGAGIVADSVPEREYEETLSKARALLAVLGM